MKRTLLCCLLSLLMLTTNTLALEVTDDIGRTVKLDRPAQRIVSLAPHITENLFAAGAGQRVIGAVSYSDFPEQASQIPRVGGYNNFNIELIVAMQPDLVIGWKEGNQKQQVEQLIALGMTVYINAPRALEDIAGNIEDFGLLAGTKDIASVTSNGFLQRLASLRSRYATQKEITVFYQTWHKPLITVNRQQFIGRIIELCGGRNVFAGLGALTPQVSVEAVIESNPDVIIASGMGDSRPEWLDEWKKWTFLNAVKHDNLFFVPPNIIQRHSPRLLDGAQKVCEFLQTIRDAEVRADFTWIESPVDLIHS